MPPPQIYRKPSGTGSVVAATVLRYVCAPVRVSREDEEEDCLDSSQDGADGFGCESQGFRRARKTCVGNDDARDAFFGCGGSLEHPDFGMAALQVGRNEWVILTDENSTRLEVSDDQDVVGVIGPREYGNSPALLVLEDRRLLRAVGSDWSIDLPRANADIVHVSASHANPFIAYATETGEVVIYSLTHEADLYRLEAGSH